MAIPINITVVLALCGKFLIQFDTNESARLSPHAADEAHGAVHVAGDVDHVANIEGAIGDGSRGHGAAVQGLKRGLAVYFGLGDGAQGGRGGGAGLADARTLQTWGGGDGAQVLLGRCFVSVRHVGGGWPDADADAG